MDTRIIDRPAFRLVGHAAQVPLIHRGRNPHIEAHIASLSAEERGRLEALGDTEPAGLLHVSANVDPDYAEGSQFTFLFGVALDTPSPVPDGIDLIEVPTGMWAVFRTTASFQSAWMTIVSEWFPSNPWRLRPGPSILTDRGDEHNTATAEVWIPIAGDVEWDNHIVWIRRQHYPGRGWLVIKQTKGRRDRPVPMLDALEPILGRLTDGKVPDDPLLRGPRGGVLTTATVRDATHWDDLVKELGFDNLTRHGLRHTGATWMADTGIALHVLQEILGHQSIETTKGYLHPDHRHLAEAARQANQFLSASDTTRRDGPRL